MRRSHQNDLGFGWGVLDGLTGSPVGSSGTGWSISSSDCASLVGSSFEATVALDDDDDEEAAEDDAAADDDDGLECICC